MARVMLEPALVCRAPTEAAIAQLLAKPIDVDGAVRIALTRNQRLQALESDADLARDGIKP
jgi:hypothetical protein